MYQPYPSGSLDHLYYQLIAAAQHLEEINDELHWGGSYSPRVTIPPTNDVQHWEDWEHRYRLAEDRMCDAEIAMLKALGQY
jgi:hypothetical protein